jgi:hypothetical protein
MQTTMTSQMRQRIDLTSHCAGICLETMQYCLQQSGPHAEQSHIRLMEDCAEICRTASDFMARGSQFHGEVCGVCADVCAACADECARFGDDEMMQRCAQTCRECADMCREMARAS